jgi:hypothetical protein
MPSSITIPIEIQLTPRSRAIMAALAEADGHQAETATPIPDLQPGEHYAGVVLDESGQVTHHLVLMAPRPDKKLQWQAAMDWAASVGGALPTRQEQALLYANCKPHIKPEWHWSSETHADDASYAWHCTFSLGYQGYSHKSAEGSAVAVRRV